MLRRDFLALLVALAACERGAKPPATAARIVSLSPSTTEAVCAIGARASLVGRSRYCNYPADVASVPDVGGYIDPNLETILTLAPDLVTGARGPSGKGVEDMFASRGIATYFPMTESFAEIDAMILGLGDRMGRGEGARAVVDGMRTDEAALDTKLAGKTSPRVLFVFGVAPIVVAGPGSFANEMISRAHASNAVTEGSGYPTLGIERVLALDPDFVIEAAFGESGKLAIAKGAPGWGKLRALQNDRVAHLTDESVLRPGPRVVRGVEALARAIYGF